MITETLFCDVIVGGVDRTLSADTVIHLIELGQADTSPFGNREDLVRITRNPTDAKTLIIDLIPLTLRADTFNRIEISLTAAFAIRKDLIDATSNDAVIASVGVAIRTFAVHFDRIVGSVSRASGTDSTDVETSLSAVAPLEGGIVDFVGIAWDTADSQRSIEELVGIACDADTTNHVIADLADALLVHKVLVGSARRRSHWKRSLRERGIGLDYTTTVVELISLDAVTTILSAVINRVSRASVANTVNADIATLTDAGD